MAATVQIVSLHGATGITQTQIDGTNMRFKLADNDTADTANAIPIPISGTNRSWIKQLKFKVTVTPANTINNLKVYTDGSNGLGTGVSVNVKTYLSGSYINPSIQGVGGLSGTANLFGYIAGSPLATSGSIDNPNTGTFGDIIAMQMAVASTATGGITPGETVTYEWDEI